MLGACPKEHTTLCVGVPSCSCVCLLCGCAPFCLQACGCERVVASVIPRFIPTCSQALLEGLGDLAQQEELNLVVHSHISESRSDQALAAGTRGQH